MQKSMWLIRVLLIIATVLSQFYYLSFLLLLGSFIAINCSFCRNVLKSTLTTMQRTVFHLFTDFELRYLQTETPESLICHLLCKVASSKVNTEECAQRKAD